MKTKEITQANRAAWDAAALLHRSQNMEDLQAAFCVPGHSCLGKVETAILQALDIGGKDVAQLCCSNGQELQSIAEWAHTKSV